MPEGAYNHPLFGQVKFRTANPTKWVRGDKIIFLSGFDLADVTPVFIPQLKNVKGSDEGRVDFYKGAHGQILQVFNLIEAKGMLQHIKTVDTQNARLRKPTNGAVSKLPSNHSFGTAIDINEDDPGNGASAAPLAPMFTSCGFTWGQIFSSPDPMHFEVNRLLKSVELEKMQIMNYSATKQHVYNRGVPPDEFLDQLIAWGKAAPEELFVPNGFSDVYSSVKNTLGPYEGNYHRRAVMIEVMRVLAGFESSWNWNAGVDRHNPTSVTPETIEAGAWQVSANSMIFGADLKDLVLSKVGTLDGNDFQMAMKENHPLAMEYIVRLLRHTTRHHGPVRRHEIDPWLRRDAVIEFQELMN